MQRKSDASLGLELLNLMKILVSELRRE